MVRAAGVDATRGSALETLCERYWRPVYAWVRRSGRGAEDAEDLTQAFFAKVLEQHSIERADRERGRFRSYLLAMLQRFLADDWDRSRAQRRGGGKAVFSLDVASVEASEALALPGAESPERAFDRRWALDVVEQARGLLREECAAAKKGEIFEALFVSAAEETQAALAARLGITENAVKMTARRLRRRLEEHIRAVVAETVSTREDLEGEIRQLMEALAG